MNWKVSCVRPLSRILSLIEICRNLFLTLESGHLLQVFLKHITRQENIKQATMITTARKSRNLFLSKKSSPRRLSRISSIASFSYIGSSTPMMNCSFFGLRFQYSMISEYCKFLFCEGHESSACWMWSTIVDAPDYESKNVETYWTRVPSTYNLLSSDITSAVSTFCLSLLSCNDLLWR